MTMQMKSVVGLLKQRMKNERALLSVCLGGLGFSLLRVSVLVMDWWTSSERVCYYWTMHSAVYT